MPSNRQSGRPTSADVPPTTRRSARQQRIASREASRQLVRAGTRGSSGGGNQFMLYTIGAVVIAAVVIAGALFLTQPKSGGTSLGSPIAPASSMVTPAGLQSNGATLGDPNAAVTIEVYSDYQCPNCWTFSTQIAPKLIAAYVVTGKAKLVYRDLIVVDTYEGGTTESLDASNAARCAADQGKFWQYHDWLYANQFGENKGAYTKDRLKAIAAAMGGLDLGKFNACVDSGSHDAEIKAEEKSIPSGVNATPSVLVNGTLLTSYDYEAIAAAVDKVLGVSPSPSVSATATPTPVVTAAPTAAPSDAPAASPKAS